MNSHSFDDSSSRVADSAIAATEVDSRTSIAS
jgi:hypothetical protein